MKDAQMERIILGSLKLWPDAKGGQVLEATCHRIHAVVI
jgi:hypothetical protein